jgi:hypothetical protein
MEGKRKILIISGKRERATCAGSIVWKSRRRERVDAFKRGNTIEPFVHLSLDYDHNKLTVCDAKNKQMTGKNGDASGS